MRNFVIISIIIAYAFIGCKPEEVKEVSLTENLSVSAKLIHSDNFDHDLSNWLVEQMPNGSVELRDGKMEVNDAGGCTVWFKPKLKGPTMIEYDAHLIQKGGEYDRVSDLNCFWMASDHTHHDKLFANSDFRQGRFPNYDSLSLYYVGMGGHHNTKTRFRKYLGTGEKPLLPQYDLTDKQYLLTPNTTVKIRLIAYDGIIQYYRDGRLIFDYRDDNPYTEGNFGLRTVHNHMTLDNFKVYQLKGI
ncbi:DUF6250 domain-containing protein [Persicobacter psychrovividus]|uniref:DUF6250 domain-containing protein n=1 Tax=Persicobacter psychrovividus TaxID=387638 RepID=A0ABN6LFU0_9BACT|nr:hypothetical protein PEPS_43210 [Persicobacter psychrovividus]